MSEIVDNLWIGDWTDTLDENRLTTMGVTHVLCVVPHYHAPDEMRRHYSKVTCEHWHYEDWKDIEIDFPLDFISEALQEGGILVHCGAGIDRSPTVVMLFLHLRTGLSVNVAINWIKSKRPIANPHPEEVRKWLNEE